MKRTNDFYFGFLAAILLAGGIWFVWNQAKTEENEPSQLSNHPTLQVRVEGAVADPGVYTMDKDSRLMDALAAAGGLLPSADGSRLNLAAPLYNMQKIQIPYLNDNQSPPRLPVSTDLPTAAFVPEKAAPLPVFQTVQQTSSTAIPCAETVTGNGLFLWPTDNRFLSGSDYSSTHPGIDIAAAEGAPIYAADSGMIRMEGNDGSGYGNLVEIDHGNGYSTRYAHLSVIGVQACQGVYAGQWIGAAGSTGNSTGPHLHFEVTFNDEYVNPWSVFPAP